MSKGDISRIIANTINETARGDPDDLAARIVAALTEAGFRIVSADGREDTALGPARRRKAALPQPQRGHLVSCPRSRDGLGLCQAPSQRPVRRSGDRHGDLRIP